RIAVYGAAVVVADAAVDGLLSLFFLFQRARLVVHSFPTRRSSDLGTGAAHIERAGVVERIGAAGREAEQDALVAADGERALVVRSEAHTSELQSRREVVCRLLLQRSKAAGAVESGVGAGDGEVYGD